MPELAHGNCSALALSHLMALWMLAVGLARVFVGGLVSSGYFSYCVGHLTTPVLITKPVVRLSKGLTEEGWTVGRGEWFGAGTALHMPAVAPVVRMTLSSTPNHMRLSLIIGTDIEDSGGK